MKKLFTFVVIFAFGVVGWRPPSPAAPVAADETASVAKTTNAIYSGFYNKPTFDTILLNSLAGAYSPASPGELTAPTPGEYQATFKYSGMANQLTGLDISVYKNTYPIATTRIFTSTDGYGGIVSTGPISMTTGDRVSVNINVSYQGALATFYRYQPGVYEDAFVLSLTRIR